MFDTPFDLVDVVSRRVGRGSGWVAADISPAIWRQSMSFLLFRQRQFYAESTASMRLEPS
jgi:hypothetical protein